MLEKDLDASPAFLNSNSRSTTPSSRGYRSTRLQNPRTIYKRRQNEIKGRLTASAPCKAGLFFEAAPHEKGRHTQEFLQKALNLEYISCKRGHHAQLSCSSHS